MKKREYLQLQGSIVNNLFNCLVVNTDGSETVLDFLGIKDPYGRCVHQVGMDL
jgi:hypothetical protein